MNNIDLNKSFNKFKKQFFMMQESYDWIVNCIYSSTNQFHLLCCAKLIALFNSQFKAEAECEKLTSDLLLDCREQETSICVEI
jgi:hypothetical protein